MKHATVDDFEDIKNLFKKYKDIFPHVRMDRILRKIKKGQVIFEDGVIITYVVKVSVFLTRLSVLVVRVVRYYRNFLIMLRPMYTCL